MIWKFDTYLKNTAIVQEDGNKLLYKDIATATQKLADQVKQRCLVFSLATNQVGSLVGYVSFLNHDIVPFMAEASLNAELLASLQKTYKPDYIWCPSDMADTFNNCTAVYSAFDYSLIKTPHTMAYPLLDELALLLSTSGSTGSPKLVRLSYANILANTKSIVKYLKLDDTERAITTLPMSYTYGLSIINTHLYVGASIILTEKTMMQREFWKQLKEFGVTSFGGVPYTYEILDKLKFQRMELPYLRTLTQAGGKLSPQLHKKFAEYALEKGKNFVVMYGQTEAAPRMSYLPPENTLKKYGSMGIAIPGGHFSLLDAQGNEIDEPDTDGELIYRGENVALGYARRGEDLAKGDTRNGVLKTGDIARRDTDGYYYIVGRKNRFLKVFGNRVNLDEIERMLKMAFPQTDFACDGRDDKIYVFLTTKGSQEDVRNFLSEKTKLNIVAIHAKEIEKIPKNESGKILYKELDQLC